MTLKTLKVGDSAVIDGIGADAGIVHRLESLGFVSGKTVTVIRRKTGASHVRIGTTEWVMRDSTAELIRIRDHV